MSSVLVKIMQLVANEESTPPIPDGAELDLFPTMVQLIRFALMAPPTFVPVLFRITELMTVAPEETPPPSTAKLLVIMQFTAVPELIPPPSPAEFPATVQLITSPE